MLELATKHLPLAPGQDLIVDSWLASPAMSATTERVALLSDLHLPGDSQIEISGINPTGHLEGVLQQWAAAPHLRPDYVLIGGDCAMISGWQQDYRQFADLMALVDQMGLPWRSVLGNHDCRENYLARFSRHAPRQSSLPSRHVGMIETPTMIWILLDSLEQVNAVPGQLGSAQLAWLRDVLAALPPDDKPIVVLGHHNLQFDGTEEEWFGLRDSAQLMQVLEPDPRIKAYAFGHSHRWQVGQLDSGLWLINLPALSFAFHSDQPVGWVEGAFDRSGADLRLHPLRNNGDAAAPLEHSSEATSPNAQHAPPAPPALRLSWR